MSSSPNTGSNAVATESIGEEVRPLGGAVYGAVAFAFGYVATAVLFISRVDGEFGDIGDDAFELFGWVFYNAHSIDVAVSGEAEIEPFNYIEMFDVGDPLHFKLVPAVILLILGFALATRVSEPISRERSAAVGASVAVGYVSLLVVGTFVFELEDGGVTAGPELGLSLLIVGLLYAVVFGGIGGYLAGD